MRALHTTLSMKFMEDKCKAVFNECKIMPALPCLQLGGKKIALKAKTRVSV